MSQKGGLDNVFGEREREREREKERERKRKRERERYIRVYYHCLLGIVSSLSLLPPPPAPLPLYPSICCNFGAKKIVGEEKRGKGEGVAWCAC